MNPRMNPPRGPGGLGPGIGPGYGGGGVIGNGGKLYLLNIINEPLIIYSLALPSSSSGINGPGGGMPPMGMGGRPQWQSGAPVS